MSASTAPARTARAGGQPAGRPSVRRVAERAARLRVLAAPPETRRRMPFVATCGALLLLSLVGVLAVNISLSHGAYDVYVLQQRQTALVEQEQSLSEQLANESSPARLSERARALGMIPNSSPAFIRLSDGAVLGSPTPADPSLSPAVSAIPTAAELAAARQAAETAAAQAAAQAAVQQAADLAGGAVVPPEQAAAEQAALAAAQAAAAAAPPPVPLGDGAVQQQVPVP